MNYIMTIFKSKTPQFSKIGALSPVFSFLLPESYAIGPTVQGLHTIWCFNPFFCIFADRRKKLGILFPYGLLFEKCPFYVLSMSFSRQFMLMLVLNTFIKFLETNLIQSHFSKYFQETNSKWTTKRFEIPKSGISFPQCL